jgi:class 3 adenylate cyclase
MESLDKAIASETDSLKAILKKTTDEKSKVEVLNELSKAYFNDNPDTSIVVAITSKKIAEKIGFTKGLALALKNIGIGYYYKGKNLEAISNWQKALDLYKSMGDKRGVANMLGNIASVYYNEGDEAKSLELDLESLKISEEINDTLRIVTSLINIGTVYSNKQATYKKAIDNFSRAFELSKRVKDNYLIGTSALNIGEINFKLNKDEIALIYFKESLRAFEEDENYSAALNWIGKIYARQKNYLLSVKTHLEAFNLSKKLDLKLDMSRSLIGLGQVYLAKGDINEAKTTFLKALEYATELKATLEIKDIYEGLSTSYAQSKDFSNAFKYQNLLLAIKDTIYNINTDKKLGTLQFTFDIEKKESQINLLTKDKEIQQQEITRQKIVRNSFIGGFAIVLLFAAVFFKQRNRIGKEKKRSDELLLNILPEEVAEELKEKGEAEAKLFNEVSVLFTDFKGFTAMSEKLTPKELVKDIHECFSGFDRIMEKYGIEKIKTIGDAYMAAGGIPVPIATHAVDIVNAAFEIRQFIEDGRARKIAEGLPFFEIRIGIHTGPVVAGIVGVKKFAYDIWGDTVNTASRMESSGAPGKINISSTTYKLVKDKFKCEHRGKIAAKGKGEIDMYFVEKLEN